MFAREVQGLTLPALVAGHPALELCNTFVAWDEPQTGDYLLSYAHLAVLADDLGLLPAGRTADLRPVPDDEAAKALRAAVRFREHLFRVVTQESPEPAHVAGFRRTVAEALSAADLLRGPDGQLGWQPGAAVGAAAPLHGFAIAAAELVSSGARGVGRCPGDGCSWLFLDPSGRRRWCIMAVCGNRAKARAHAQRTRATRA